MYEFKLFIARTPSSSGGIEDQLNALLKESLDGEFSLEVVNVLENPEQAVAAKIFATPTMIKFLPIPEARIIGNFTNREKVFMGLGLE